MSSDLCRVIIFNKSLGLGDSREQNGAIDIVEKENRSQPSKRKNFQTVEAI